MVDVIGDATRPQTQRRARDLIYWVVFAFRPLLGAGLVLVYLRSGSDMNAISDFGTGLTAPSIIQALSRKVHTPVLPDNDVEP